MKKKICTILGIIIVAIIVAGFIIDYVSSSKEKLEYNSQYSIDLDTNNIISNRTDNEPSKKEHFFYGKIIESTDSYIIVEPNEGEEVRNSADKISIGLGEYNDALIEEIIAKANQDAKGGKIKAEMYKDGGSMEYHYENYTIIKCHTIDGNRDVYIGSKSLNLNDVI